MTLRRSPGDCVRACVCAWVCVRVCVFSPLFSEEYILFASNCARFCYGQKIILIDQRWSFLQFPPILKMCHKCPVKCEIFTCIILGSSNRLCPSSHHRHHHPPTHTTTPFRPLVSPLISVNFSIYPQTNASLWLASQRLFETQQLPRSLCNNCQSSTLNW